MAQDSQDSKARKIGYWVATAVLAAAMAMSGVFDLMQPPELVAAMEHLGYPTHLLILLGIGKLLAVIAILVPKFPRIKEWAYAGLSFDLLGAVWSHTLSGDPIGEYAMIFVFLALLFTSYFLRPASRRLPSAGKPAAPAPAPAPAPA